jgi:K+-sensing histidine kinase KdpD
LRIIKNNTLRYEAFHKMLPTVTKGGTAIAAASLLRNGLEKESNGNSGSSYNSLIELSEFLRNLKNTNDRNSLDNNLSLFIKNMLKSKESGAFFFNEDQTSVILPSTNVSSRTGYFINNLFKSGVLKDICSNGVHKIIMDSLVYNIDGTKSYYLIVPFWGRTKYKGFLLALLPYTVDENSIEIHSIKLSLEMFLQRLELIEKQEELKNTYNQLHVYQSKLTNDFKLSAIGELTTGIVEDILSPLQVIQSSTEFLKHDNTVRDENVLDTINVQIKKVKNVINRLIKFANTGTGDVKNKIYPCSLNNIINDFYNMFNSSLKNSNYECVLDLENNIPSLLTNENYINQILTNIFHLIKAGGNKAGGIFIQTRSINEKVMIKFLSTDYFEELNNNAQNRMQDINLKIIKNILLRHEGEIKYESNKNKGTIIILSFPLKRKIIR